MLIIYTIDIILTFQLLNELEKIVLTDKTLFLCVDQQEKKFVELGHWKSLLNLAGTKENTLNQIYVNTNFNLVGTVLVERKKHTANLVSNNLSKTLLQESFYLSSGSP